MNKKEEEHITFFVGFDWRRCFYPQLNIKILGVGAKRQTKIDYNIKKRSDILIRLIKFNVHQAINDNIVTIHYTIKNAIKSLLLSYWYLHVYLL